MSTNIFDSSVICCCQDLWRTIKILDYIMKQGASSIYVYQDKKKQMDDFYIKLRSDHFSCSYIRVLGFRYKWAGFSLGQHGEDACFGKCKPPSRLHGGVPLLDRTMVISPPYLKPIQKLSSPATITTTLPLSLFCLPPPAPPPSPSVRLLKL